MVMHVRGKDSLDEIYTDITVLERVESFKYLVSIKSEDVTCPKDVKARIALAKQKMLQLNNILKDIVIPNQLKI